MSRPLSPLPVEHLERALAYLQRAVDRRADVFSRGTKETGRSLATLRRRALTLRRDDFAAQANEWLAAHLTQEGRRTMLAALRRQVADAVVAPQVPGAATGEPTLGQLLAEARGLVMPDAALPTGRHVPTEDDRKHVKAVLIRAMHRTTVLIRNGCADSKVALGATHGEQSIGFAAMVAASRPADLVHAVDDPGFPFHREWRWLTDRAAIEQLALRIERTADDREGGFRYWLTTDPIGC